MFQIDHSPISFSESFSSSHHSSSSVSAILIYKKWLVVPDPLSLHTASSSRWCTGAPPKNSPLWGPPTGGCVFPCSLWKFTVVPLFLKNKLRCSPKFTSTEFPCSQKFRSMFPWSPKIFLTVPYNSFGEEQNIWFVPRPGPEKWEKL